MARSLTFLLAAAFWLIASAAFASVPVVTDTSLDRTTPRRAYAGFDTACSHGDFEHAAQYLDLRAAPHRPHEGAELARQLCYVMARKAPVDIAALPDVSEMTGNVTVTTITVDEEPIAIEVGHVRFADGVSRWLVARATVAAIPQLDAAFGPRGTFDERLPTVLREPRIMAMAPWQWLGIVLFAILALIVARLFAWVLLAGVSRIVKQTSNTLDDHLVNSVRSPMRLLVAVAAFRAGAPFLAFAADAWTTVARVLSALTIVGFAWLATRMMHGGATWLEERASEADREYRSRGLRTQLAVLYRVASIVVFVIAIAAVLLQFEVVRSVGTSLLASAGIAGITIGLAAQKSLGAIVAGVQISIAQPVRIGDTVVVDKEQGTVEEIHLTYIVLRLSDDRRLIAPIGRFLEQPFENWTKLGSELRGYVTVPADFGTPIDAIRAKLEEICKASPKWDGRFCRIDVTEVTADKALTLRATVSAKDADALWDLRCTVREALVTFLATLDQGKHVPRARAQTVS